MGYRVERIGKYIAYRWEGEASDILCRLGFQRQKSDVAALTIPALLDLKPGDPWSGSSNPLIGITPMMYFFKKHYGKTYAPNSRERVRRHAIHHFLQASLVTVNPDDPDRPTNSGKTAYQIDGDALRLIKSFGTRRWSRNLAKYKAQHPSLERTYAMKRRIKKIRLRLSDGTTLRLSPGGQSILVEKICHDFGSRFVPGGTALLVGDTAKDSGHHDKSRLEELGVVIDPHGKVPDVIIHDTCNDWLVVVEAVTSHGPIDLKRRQELEKVFSKSRIGVVYVTAFLNKDTMLKHFRRISWQTDVWVADSPDHMIHLDGAKLLGPYTDGAAAGGPYSHMEALHLGPSGRSDGFA